MKSKKLDISSKELLQSFYSDKQFIAIHSSSDFLELLSQIYLYMGMKFRKINHEVELLNTINNIGLFTDQGPSHIVFPIFQCLDPTDKSEYTIYQNRVSSSHLIPSLTNTDYIWMIGRCNDLTQRVQDLITRINLLPSVQVSRPLHTQDIKEKQRLIL